MPLPSEIMPRKNDREKYREAERKRFNDAFNAVARQRMWRAAERGRRLRARGRGK